MGFGNTLWSRCISDMIVAPYAVVVAELGLDVDHVPGGHPRSVLLLEGDKWRIHIEPLPRLLMRTEVLSEVCQSPRVILILGDDEVALKAVVLLPNPEETIYVAVV